MINIADESANINLDQLAAKIRVEFGQTEAAGRDRVEHAIAAGQYLLQVKELIGRGLKRWLSERDLSRSNSYDYMKLAQNAETVRSSGHSSIVAALRMLRAKSESAGSKSAKTSDKSSSPLLTKAAWTKSNNEERQQFLDEIGANSLCASLSFALRAELRRRVASQKRASTSPLDETIAKAIRQALSLQKVSKGGTPAAGVAAALNVINTKLEAAGMDLNYVTVTIDPSAVHKRRAA
jgi:hypothetical protein